MRVTIERIQAFGLTLKQVEQKIVKHDGYADSTLLLLLNDLRVQGGNDMWKRMPIDDIGVLNFLEEFLEKRILSDTDSEQLKKVDALLFVLNQANKLQERHGKPPIHENFIFKLENLLEELS